MPVLSSNLCLAWSLVQTVAPELAPTSPELGLLHGELDVIGDDDQVSAEGELESGTNRVTLNCRDDDWIYVAPTGERVLEASNGGIEICVGKIGHP